MPPSPRLLLALALLSVAFVALLPSAPCRVKRRPCPPPSTCVEPAAPKPCAAPAEEASESPTEPAVLADPPKSCASPVEEATESPTEPAVLTGRQSSARPAAPKPCAAPAEEASESPSEPAVLTGRRSSARPAAERAFDPALYPWAPADRRIAVLWDWDGAADSDDFSPATVATLFHREASAVESLRSGVWVGSEGEGTYVALLPEGGDPAPALVAVRNALDRLAAAFPDRKLRVRWPDAADPPAPPEEER